MRASNYEQEQFIAKKAYEICYAVFRVASQMKKQGFADHLENQALTILESAVAGEYNKAEAAISSAGYLLQIGSDIGLIHEANAQVIRKELNGLRSLIAESGNAAKAPFVNLDDVFSGLPAPIAADTAVSKTEDLSSGRIEDGGQYDREDGFLENGNGHSVAKAAIRQNAILERVRQNGNCRLKEIQEVLPDISERTLRYDLQRLIEQGLIERVGNGGPATAYRIKEEVLPN